MDQEIQDQILELNRQIKFLVAKRDKLAGVLSAINSIHFNVGDKVLYAGQGNYWLQNGAEMIVQKINRLTATCRLVNPINPRKALWRIHMEYMKRA